ncbi:hypothetical protein EC957_001932 [Mortierella hygrophila]|uniref:Uncharacterized protein n=1 Tax=Mortierella hygrophila TaxID=979708 RepID=A0A9P6K225_9FUNG|nr:hypothetical protein EC957_001932 [Mortierella hygrophila]
MDEHDERTSLVRSNGTSNRVGSPSHSNNNNNNEYNTLNGNHHQQNNNSNPGRRDPRTFFAQVQQSLGLFQTWAAKVLHENQESPVVNWVQNARVAKTFMMIINVVLAVFAFLLMGVEMMEMALREPILDYLLPESEMTLLAAGLTIVVGVFGFAVAYNLLVEDTANDRCDRDNDEGRQGNGSGGNGRDSGPRTSTQSYPTDNLLGQNNDPPLVVQHQQARGPRLMFTKASTYLLNGNAILLVVVLVVFTIAVAQRSVHLSQMDKELNNAWTDTYRHRQHHISDFELRHHCCGLNHLTDRPFPPVDKPTLGETCSENISYGFKVPCKAELSKDFARWQTRIQQLLLVQVTMLVPLLLLVVTLSAIGFSKRTERKQERPDDTEAQAEEARVVPVLNGGGVGVQFERPLLGDVEHSTPFLVNIEAEPVRQTNDRPVVQPSLI